MKRPVLALLLIVLALQARAQQRVAADYIRVLLPVHRSVSTPQGTWFAQLWFRNEGDVPADVFPLAARGGLPPPPLPGGPSMSLLARPSLPAQRTVTFPASDALPSVMIPPLVPVESDGVGAFVYVERARAQRIAIGGSLQWVGVGSNAQESALRAVRETDFLSGERNIIGVPVVQGKRYALRVYALPETLTASPLVRVRVYDMAAPSIDGNERLLLERVIELRVPPSRFRRCDNVCDLPDVPYVPAVAELFDLATMSTFWQPNIRIEIAPESPQVRWWGIVSSTDNLTNSVAIFEVAAR